VSELEPLEPPPRPDVPPGAVLAVRDLRVEFDTDDGVVTAVDGLSFDIRENEVLAVVGESGSGKSVTAMAVMGLLPRTARVTGEVLFRGTPVLGLDDRELSKIRGRRIAMVFQDALTALNPVYTVSHQIAEAINVHQDLGKPDVENRVKELLALVGIPNPAQRMKQYPHEFSGGMRQRAMIAMAIANEPDVLIADEPTTALDVTIQAQVLDVLERVQRETRSAIVLITHDLGVVAGVADRVMVMYAGRQVELGHVDPVFYEPRHPYTLGLLASLPRVDREERDQRLYRIKGQPPSLLHVPSGCAFHPRCDYAQLPEPCQTQRPELRATDPMHLAACHFAEDLAEESVTKLRTRASTR
jgi:oligopeptide/dipeptide ABC transporter ATP-binding protein